MTVKSQLNRTEIVIRPAILQDINKATKDLNRIEKKKGLSVVDEVDGITAKPVQAKETKKRKDEGDGSAGWTTHPDCLLTCRCPVLVYKL